MVQIRSATRQSRREATHVGYTDSTALRRLLKKNWGMAPRPVAGV